MPTRREKKEDRGDEFSEFLTPPIEIVWQRQPPNITHTFSFHFMLHYLDLNSEGLQRSFLSFIPQTFMTSMLCIHQNSITFFFFIFECCWEKLRRVNIREFIFFKHVCFNQRKHFPFLHDFVLLALPCLACLLACLLSPVVVQFYPISR